MMYRSDKVPRTWSRGEWCREQFGNPGVRWYRHRGRFYFRSESDLVLFTLRWAGVDNE